MFSLLEIYFQMRFASSSPTVRNAFSINKADTEKRSYSDIRLFSGSDNFEVGRQVLEGEFVAMTSLCNSFYILCTTRGSINVHSSRTTQVVMPIQVIIF